MNTPNDNPRTAVLLIAHGSRRPEANADLVKLAESVRSRGGYAIVEIAYLELADPTIPAGIAQCVKQSADEVLMLPYFLSAGSHVVEDLERFRQEAQAQYPQVAIRLCAPLGLHPLMVDLVMHRLREGHDS